MITYLEGDATYPQGDGPKVIPHIVNDRGLWGKGFVLAVSRRWSEPEETYRRRTKRSLGQIQIIPVEGEIWVVNMIAQNGVRSEENTFPIRYPALVQCLDQIAIFTLDHQASIHMPRIGAGLAGGDWDTIASIIYSSLIHRGLKVSVYDLPKR